MFLVLSHFEGYHVPALLRILSVLHIDSQFFIFLFNSNWYFHDIPSCLPLRLLFVGFVNSDLQGGNTALIWAAGHGRADCVRLLIDAGADKEAKDYVRRRLLLCWAGTTPYIYNIYIYIYIYTNSTVYVHVHIHVHVLACVSRRRPRSRSSYRSTVLQ